MTDQKTGSYPDVRPIDEVLNEMKRIALACEEVTIPGPAKLAGLFERALSLMLEIRVPRMPDTDEELHRMLVSGSDGPTYTGDDVMERLAISQRRFQDRLARYHTLIGAENLLGAADMLSPDGKDPIIRWEAAFHLWTASMDGHVNVIVEHDGASISCTSDNAGLATLGALMRAHQWPNTWKR